MPENYCSDNFFKKMTDLDSPRKNNDCYFYYYSKCAKGDSCTFRHEPSALGCETMCSFWKEGKCLNVHCNFRHMELRKNRKAIQCYWETQPGGCLKAHCPFLHQNPRPNAADDSIDSKTDSGTESADNTMNEKLTHMNEKSFKSPPVDSLVVNFEEESDNESAPTNSPIKPTHHRSVKVKTLEEIKLEKIQAESAAYYSYSAEQEKQNQDGDDLRKRILQRLSSKGAKKRSLEFPTNSTNAFKKQKKEGLQPQDISGIKIKTLEEIRAERAKKTEQQDNAICDSLVTSSTTEIVTNTESVKKPKKIKLLRKPVVREQQQSVLDCDEEMAALETTTTTTHNIVSEEKVLSSVENVDVDVVDDDDEMKMESSTNNKTLDEVLLLQDDDDNDNVSLKEEERLLNDIDDLLEED